MHRTIWVDCVGRNISISGCEFVGLLSKHFLEQLQNDDQSIPPELEICSLEDSTNIRVLGCTSTAPEQAKRTHSKLVSYLERAGYVINPREYFLEYPALSTYVH